MNAAHEKSGKLKESDVLDTAAIFRSAIEDLSCSNVTAARDAFAACAEADFRTADAVYFMAVCAHLEGDDAGALELLKWSKSSGSVSPDFFGGLGQVIAGLGDTRGDELRRFLQRNRRIPWQLVGSVMSGDSQKTVEPWFFSRQAMNKFPKHQSEFADLQGLIERSILPGFIPAAPLFGRESSILTLGSCFAQELRNYLVERGMRSDWLFVPPGLNNTFAARQFVEWCATGNQSSDAFWYDEATGGGAKKWQPDVEQKHYRGVLESVDALVLTVGLAEIWYDVDSGGVFWRGVPKSIYDPSKHKCRMSTVEENVSNLNRTIDVLRDVHPGLPIVITLSPVPLRATFENVSCFAADSVSKSILRVAIDQVMKRGVAGVHYWPSFEIVRWLGSHIEQSLFGEDGNTRHVNRLTVRLILESFIKHYFYPDSQI